LFQVHASSVERSAPTSHGSEVRATRAMRDMPTRRLRPAPGPSRSSTALGLIMVVRAQRNQERGGARACRREDRMEFRRATPSDVDAIARLHADSWRRNYRGAYSDEFLDGNVVADRLATWTDRLVRTPSASNCTLVAQLDGVVVGFAHAVVDEDPMWGSLVDNLHVIHGVKRRGIGSRLMSATAEVVLARARSNGLYLWVLKQNTAAQSFYEAIGGVQAGEKISQSPAGDTTAAFRYAWRDATVLIASELAPSRPPGA
jgi:ribosomal protein S18 acetylase RimI-like enzyme